MSKATDSQLQATEQEGSAQESQQAGQQHVNVADQLSKSNLVTESSNNEPPVKLEQGNYHLKQEHPENQLQQAETNSFQLAENETGYFGQQNFAGSKVDVAQPSVVQQNVKQIAGQQAPSGAQDTKKGPSIPFNMLIPILQAHLDGAIANMESQFDQVSQQQQQEHKNMATSSTQRTGKTLEPKTIRRLAQNREAARKSRLRKKAYIQQLESSKLKLAQMEQDIQRARSQGLLLGGAPGANTSSGAAMFDMEYVRWLDDHGRRMAELHGALHAHLPEGDLRAIVDDVLTHYDELFRLKAMATKSDVFHLITGVWASPAERCFLWMGGFRPSNLLKTLLPQLDPLTEQQVIGICNLQQSSQQAEEALFQGLEQLHQSLADTMASGSIIDDANMSFMGQMALALSKLSNLEGFVIQADNLRQQTLHQMHRILTVRQAARCFLAIGEYHNRLRALSSLWASRPREILVADEGNCGEISIAAQPPQNQFSAF